MKRGLVDKKITPACEYCAIGRLSPDGEHILCVKKGVCAKDSSCGHFSYDVLKRVPKRHPSLLGAVYDEEDFRID